ncbi:MAG: hypothetical protein NTY24_07275 [Mycobacterium sp.]|nr:hypothetical protein [Mycobacterium sp.]
MSAAHFIGRAAGIAAALGVGVAVLQGTAVAGAETDRADTPSRASASAESSQSDSATPSRRATQGTGSKSELSAPVRGRNGSAVRELAAVVPGKPSASASTVPALAATTVTLAAPSATLPAAIAEQSAEIFSPTPPDPTATVQTQYGALGQWMINKEGQVADWVGQRYCGPGSTVSNCGVGKPDEGKIMQEPINTIFVVQARNQYLAELKLDFAMRVSGFGPSCCSSVGYSGIVGDTDYKQFPRGGPLGLGLLPPLPFGLFQNGLLGLIGFGPAYRDASFLIANNHLRTFGGMPDGNGNYIFTASVSEENLDTTGGGLLPTHGFESYNEARNKLLTDMLATSWLTQASNQGLIAMDNAIDPLDPTYTTGDHDGLAQVIALGSLWGMASPVRSAGTGSSATASRATTSAAVA